MINNQVQYRKVPFHNITNCQSIIFSKYFVFSFSFIYPLDEITDYVLSAIDVYQSEMKKKKIFLSHQCEILIHRIGIKIDKVKSEILVRLTYSYYIAIHVR